MEASFLAALEEGHDTTKGLKQLEAEYIEYVLILAKYNQSKAAKMLGLSRGCVRMKLKEYFQDKYL